MKIDKNLFGSWIKSSGILAGSLTFSRNCVEVENRREPGVKEGYKRIKLQQKYMLHFPYFSQDLNSGEKLVGILAHVRFPTFFENQSRGQWPLVGHWYGV